MVWKAASTSHDVEMCFDLYPEKRRGGGVGVRILSIPVHVYENEQLDPEEPKRQKHSSKPTE